MSSDKGTVYVNSEEGEVQSAPKDDLSKKYEKLDELAVSAGIIIHEVRSLKPFLAPFRDTLTICPNRITITKNSMFASDEYPMPIDRVTNAKVYRHLFWGSLEIETFGVPKPDPMAYLDIKEARLARRYILALIECNKQEIDLTGLNLHELRKKLKEIGMVRFGTYEADYHDI